MIEFNLLSAFLIGLLGSGHCISMCGGVSGLLSSSIKKQPTSTKTTLVICYHLGRILSYAAIGGLVAFSSGMMAYKLGMPLAYLRLLAAIFLIFLGLYIAQWFMGLVHIEKIGKSLWKVISPLSKYILPVDSHKKALALGLLWGWLPCGLVYSTLTWALASGDIINGMGIMIAFGLGTTPALISLSLSFSYIKNIVKHKYFRNLTAISLILYGLYSFDIAYRTLF